MSYCIWIFLHHTTVSQCLQLFVFHVFALGLVKIKEANDIEEKLNQVEKLLKNAITMPYKVGHYAAFKTSSHIRKASWLWLTSQCWETKCPACSIPGRRWCWHSSSGHHWTRCSGMTKSTGSSRAFRVQSRYRVCVQSILGWLRDPSPASLWHNNWCNVELFRNHAVKWILSGQYRNHCVWWQCPRGKRKTLIHRLCRTYVSIKKSL